MSQGGTGTGYYEVLPIGTIACARDTVMDDDWGNVESTVRLDGTRVGAEAVAGLEEFSHLEVVFLFHRVPSDAVVPGARHPRGNTEWPRVGVLAQRAKNRVNRLGVSRCELIRVSGLDLTVRALDAIDGTPVLDIKPYMAEFGPRGEVRQPEWSRELMRNYF